jgi:hypothetical protein
VQRSNLAISLVIGVIVAVGVVATIAIGVMPTTTSDINSDSMELATYLQDSGTGPLDGKTFSGLIGLSGKPKDIKDSFVFENGKFVSTECERNCKFPAHPYFVRVNGTKIEFMSEAQCPYKNSKIVWRGTVEGNKIKGESTWVSKRWYWTMEKTLVFEGELVENSISTASTD